MSANVPSNVAPQYPSAGQMPAQPAYRYPAAVPTYPFASFGKRLLATLADTGIVLAILFLPITLGVVAIVNSVGTNDNGDVNSVTNGVLLTFGIVAVVIGFLCAVLYEPLLTARKGPHNGQTIGKQVAGVRITNLQGGPITAGQAWGRAIFKMLFSDSLCYLGYLWMLWDRQKQTWHDKVASTYVLDA